jgi:hypothetical protein
VEDAAAWWLRNVRAAERSASALGDRFCRVYFESLRGQPEKVLREVFSFIDAPLDEERAHQYVSECSREKLRGDGLEPAAFVREGRVDGWRQELSLKQRRTVWKVTANQMQSLGYEKEGYTDRGSS